MDRDDKKKKTIMKNITKVKKFYDDMTQLKPHSYIKKTKKVQNKIKETLEFNVDVNIEDRDKRFDLFLKRFYDVNLQNIRKIVVEFYKYN